MAGALVAAQVGCYHEHVAPPRPNHLWDGYYPTHHSAHRWPEMPSPDAPVGEFQGAGAEPVPPLLPEMEPTRWPVLPQERSVLEIIPPAPPAPPDPVVDGREQTLPPADGPALPANELQPAETEPESPAAVHIDEASSPPLNVIPDAAPPERDNQPLRTSSRRGWAIVAQ